MRTLAQVQNRSVNELWEEAAREFLNKNYSAELRKEAKIAATLFVYTINPVKINESSDKKS